MDSAMRVSTIFCQKGMKATHSGPPVPARLKLTPCGTESKVHWFVSKWSRAKTTTRKFDIRIASETPNRITDSIHSTPRLLIERVESRTLRTHDKRLSTKRANSSVKNYWNLKRNPHLTPSESKIAKQLPNDIAAYDGSTCLTAIDVDHLISRSQLVYTVHN